MSKDRTFLKQAALLWAAGVLGGLAVLPYAFTIQRKVIDEAIQKSGLSLGLIVLISVAQTAILLFIATMVGLWAARKAGLSAPLSLALARREPVRPILRDSWRLAVGLGLSLGALAVLLDLLFMPFMPDALRQLGREMLSAKAIGTGALASFYGGISEELLTRLFLMSLLVLGLRLLSRTKEETTPSYLLWTANILAALLFGAGHLPALLGITALTPLLLFRTLALNMIIGVGCGWLYMRRGLELAMLAHFSADLILHVLAPALMLAGLLPS